MRPSLLVSCTALVVLAACGSSTSDADAGSTDAGPLSDAGLADAGDVDAGNPGDAGGPLADAGPHGACPYQYCEDFEGYDAGSLGNGAMLGPWKTSVGGTVTVFAVDALHPHGGMRALHVSLPPGAAAHGTLMQSAPMTGLVPGNDLFGRAEIYYVQGAPDGGAALPLGVHSWIFNASGKQLDGGASAMNLGGGGAKLQLNYHPPAPLTEQSVQGGAMTAGAWHCLQWEYDAAGASPANMAKVWVDGTLAVDVPASKGWSFPSPWDTFELGFTHYQTLANPVDFYVDDFALDGQMVPCP